MSATLLIIEDSPSMLHMYQGFLQKEPFRILKAETGKAGLRILRDQRPELLLLDLKLPDIDGQQILELIAEERLGTTTLVMTAHGSINVAVDAMRLGANDFLVKPFAQERLVKTLHNAVEIRQLKTKVAVYQQLDRPSYDEMIGSSLAMQAVYRTIDSAAPSDATVFITGETGTGKELVAQALHRASSRKDGNITVLNCAAIPKDLIESELFGHVKGAFTGATTDRDGAAQMAHNGTLFLDEIGEMDIGLQSKLLRFLQSGSFQRVGSSKLEHSNARIICATNRDAWADVQAGRFREDLYYRLNVIPVALPALRERGGDVIEIARDCLRRFSERDGKAFQDFDDQVQNLLMSYSWPGNIRQLRNVIERLLILAPAGGGPIRAEPRATQRGEGGPRARRGARAVHVRAQAQHALAAHRGDAPRGYWCAARAPPSTSPAQPHAHRLRTSLYTAPAPPSWPSSAYLLSPPLAGRQRIEELHRTASRAG